MKLTSDSNGYRRAAQTKIPRVVVQFHRTLQGDPAVIGTALPFKTFQHPPRRDCVAIPFVVRLSNHERYCMIENSSTFPFVLSLSKGERLIATQSRRGGRKEMGANAKSKIPELAGNNRVRRKTSHSIGCS